MSILSLIGLVLKLGGIAIAVMFIYTLVRSDLMSPVGMIVWFAVTVLACIIAWNTTDGDLIGVIVHALLPAVVSLFAGGMLYQSDGNSLKQYIGIAAGFVVAFLLTLLLSTFMSNLVTAVLAIGLLAVLWKLFGASAAENYEKSRAREEELKTAATSRTLDYHELRELNSLTANKVDAERDRALDEYNKMHPNDEPLTDKDRKL